MTKLGAIEFDDRIIDALKDDKLVVFAGAGVSMGAPSSLLGFESLVQEISRGTGHEYFEPLDKFLGQLHHTGVSVHERAAELLSPEGSNPNELHIDLVRMFRDAEHVRIVTTNFDSHFETSAEKIFGRLPDIYRAPALPLGDDFTGIVHVHGLLSHPSSLILTDADFGKAYLTEGWARRFLIKLFDKYTVLFVGYRHNDVVMNYLSRALPADRLAGRFVLTEREGNWEILGIKPVSFNKHDGDDQYGELYEGVRKLSERARRGALDWQTRLADIAGRVPPTDYEAIGEIEHALREVTTVRFFTNHASDPAWPKWLNARNYLDALFKTEELTEQHTLLSDWLAENYAIENPDVLFELIAMHGLQINPKFWWSLAREVGLGKEKEIDNAELQRWVTILLGSAPDRADHHHILWLAEKCFSQGLHKLTLNVFLHLSKHRLELKPGFVWVDDDDDQHGNSLDVHCPLGADHWALNKIWEECVKPHLDVLAQPLLSGVTERLSLIFRDLESWDKASSEWDPISFGRSAIESHEQDRYPEEVDVLIDAARDSLVYLAQNSLPAFESWIEILVSAEVPILSRLAIHAITHHPKISDDGRLAWMLEHVGLHNISLHHELYLAVRQSYPGASPDSRQKIIDAVMAHDLPESGDFSAQMRTARSHFEWLSWLNLADPNCGLINAALDPIKAEYPKWELSDHPDFTHWSGGADWVGPRSPWTVEQLLDQKPDEMLQQYLSFEGGRFDEPDRDGLISTIREASKQKFDWAIKLAQALIEGENWDADLWPPVIHGLQEGDLDIDHWRQILEILENQQLQENHSRAIADILYSIVRDGGKPFAKELLDQANEIAASLWTKLEQADVGEGFNDWLSRAINRPSGVLAEFWVNGLSLSVQDLQRDERVIPDDYKQWLEKIALEEGENAGLARSVLSSQTAFLFGLDEDWTSLHVIPLFSHEDNNRFTQAWDGFLTWGRLYPALVESMMNAFIDAVPRIREGLEDRRRRFIEFYTALAVFHVDDPTIQLLPNLFRNSDVEDRVTFATHIRQYLRQMQSPAKDELWNSWLRGYWESRLHGVLAALDTAEIRIMLEWLLHLDEKFPDGVALAIRSPKIDIEHSFLLHQLRESDLVAQFPEDTAMLLIYLCGCEIRYHAVDIGEVASRLPLLDADLKGQLDEALAQAGIQRE